TEIIESDENFNPDDYIKPILDGGIFRNKQYIMPFNYTTIVFLSVASKTDEIGFDMSKISDPLSFINEIVRTLPKAQESPLFKSMVNGGMWLNLHLSSGVQIVDFEANTILPMEAELEELVKAYKPYQPFDDVLRPGYGWYDELASHLLNGTAIFGQVWGITDFIMLAGQLNSVADIQINVLSDIHGKTHVSTALGAAIRSGSPNTQNAWNFIKLLLSQEYQSSDAILNIPVHKNSILVKIEKMYNQFDEVPVGGFITAKLSADEIEKYIEYITNINQSIIFGSWQANTMFVEHMEYFYTGKLSYEETINGLKNQLQIYISE
ncbi:MAG: extracellular solute-binding protein, partial [Oscillospiraceae bacterium]|nr:extracellular solute-binding protein [Oscillospiraceae bacterium]